jgi:hypothetical protein
LAEKIKEFMTRQPSPWIFPFHSLHKPFKRIEREIEAEEKAEREAES